MSTTTEKDVQNAIDKAFKGAANNLTYTLEGDDKKQIQSIKLKSPAYFELQAYIHVGITTLAGTEAWNLFVTAKARQLLANVDVSVFAETVTTFTDIHTHCVDFDAQTMGKFVTIASSISSYCDDTIKYIKGKDLMGDQIAIFFKTKKSDPAHTKALHIVRALCQSLARKSKANSEACEKLKDEIESFANTTAGDRAAVYKLEHKFVGHKADDGKFYVVDDSGNFVTKDGNKLVNYLTQIRGKSEEYANKAVQERKKANEDWDKWRDLTIVASTAVTYLAIPVIGWFAGPAVAIGCGVAADLAKKDMVEQERLAREDEEMAQALNLLTNTVTAVICQLDLTERVMNDAIKALDQLKQTFLQQATELENVHSAMNTIDEEITRSDSSDVADIFVNEALTAWAKVRELSQDFIKHSGIRFEEVKH